MLLSLHLQEINKKRVLSDFIKWSSHLHLCSQAGGLGRCNQWLDLGALETRDLNKWGSDSANVRKEPSIIFRSHREVIRFLTEKDEDPPCARPPLLWNEPNEVNRGRNFIYLLLKSRFLLSQFCQAFLCSPPRSLPLFSVQRLRLLTKFHKQEAVSKPCLSARSSCADPWPCWFSCRRQPMPETAGRGRWAPLVSLSFQSDFLRCAMATGQVT